MPQKLADDLYVFNTGSLTNNCYLIVLNNNVVLIDPSFYVDEIKEYVCETNLSVVGIILTHGHYDHSAPVDTLSSFYKCKTFIHILEKDILLNHNVSELFLGKNISFDVNNFIFIDSKELKIGEFIFDILLTPGHTPGGMCIKYNNYVFTGDTLMYKNIGRWDLFGGDNNKLFDSIKLMLNFYQDSDLILPGHDQDYKKFIELKKVNNYLIFLSDRK